MISRTLTTMFVAALSLSLAVALPGAAVGRTSDTAPHHCINPEGHDLNELHDTPLRIVTDFCTVTVVGERWIPAAGWVTNTSHEVIPDGYVPSRPTPIEDFNAKFAGARYVVDIGTRQERTYTFTADQILQTGLTFPGTDYPQTAFLPTLKPLSPGPHTIDIFVIMDADHWDGFDVDPADLVPAGETHWTHTAFHTVTPG